MNSNKLLLLSESAGIDCSLYTAKPPPIIPVPVPVYVPSPMMMYNMPYPVPVMVPVPLPVPVFIPTTAKTTGDIAKLMSVSFTPIYGHIWTK